MITPFCIVIITTQRLPEGSYVNKEKNKSTVHQKKLPKTLKHRIVTWLDDEKLTYYFDSN